MAVFVRHPMASQGSANYFRPPLLQSWHLEPSCPRETKKIQTEQRIEDEVKIFIFFNKFTWYCFGTGGFKIPTSISSSLMVGTGKGIFMSSVFKHIFWLCLELSGSETEYRKIPAWGWGSSEGAAQVNSWDRILVSYIRKRKCRPATTPTTPTTPAPPSRLGYPPWILKRGGLETSGPRLISLNGKTTTMAFFWGKLIFFKKSDLLTKKVFF